MGLAKTIFLPVLFFLAGVPVFAQSGIPTFSEEIAPILYGNCTKCHRQGGIGPFRLESYGHAVNNGLAIRSAVSSGYMPPWPPDTTYSRFSHERVLSQQQIGKIVDWVNGGMPQGNPALEPPVPVFPGNSELSQPPSARYQIPTYTITGNQDEYRAFVIPSQLLQNQAITEVQFFPGNRSIVHHILLFYDTSGICQALDDLDPLPGYPASGGIGNLEAKALGGWVPGSPALRLPNGFGMPAYANGKYVVQIHYAPGSAGKKDSTLFDVVYKPITPQMREVFQYPGLNHFTTLLNGPLFLPANTRKTFIEEMTTPFPVSILGVTPHMHLIGRNMTVYGLSPGSADTARILRIRDWNFNWQGLYMFRKMRVFPQGTRFRAESLYDNTTANPFNPSNPPQPVVAGESTLNEMMLTYFMFVAALPGDDQIVLDSSLITGSRPVFPSGMKEGWTLFPNPAGRKVYLIPGLEGGLAPAEGRLVDAKGQIRHSFALHPREAGFGRSYEVELPELPAGLYQIQLFQKMQRTTLPLVISVR